MSPMSTDQVNERWVDLARKSAKRPHLQAPLQSSLQLSITTKVNWGNNEGRLNRPKRSPRGQEEGGRERRLVSEPCITTKEMNALIQRV